MYEDNTMEEGKLYYLFMMADGEVSYSEEKIFNQICKELGIESETKKEIIKNCKDKVKASKDVFSVIVREKIDEEAGNNWFGLRDTSSLARIIWNLIDLGYADSAYSNEEKKIVNYLVDKWSVDEEILQEFVDTADTMLALSKQKEWILSVLPKGPERDKKEKQTDEQIKEMLEDVKLTISELTM